MVKIHGRYGIIRHYTLLRFLRTGAFFTSLVAYPLWTPATLLRLCRQSIGFFVLRRGRRL